MTISRSTEPGGTTVCFRAAGTLISLLDFFSRPLRSNAGQLINNLRMRSRTGEITGRGDSLIKFKKRVNVFCAFPLRKIGNTFDFCF